MSRPCPVPKTGAPEDSTSSSNLAGMARITTMFIELARLTIALALPHRTDLYQAAIYAAS